MAGSIVGDLIGKRSIVYAPINKAGTLFLFARLLDEFDMLIEEISADCSYVVARRRVDSGWERVVISLAFKSSDICSGSDITGDLLICWEHDWHDCPLKTFELKALFENGTMLNPENDNSAKINDDSNILNIIPDGSSELLKNREVTRKRFEKAISDLDEKIKKNFSEYK